MCVSVFVCVLWLLILIKIVKQFVLQDVWEKTSERRERNLIKVALPPLMFGTENSES